MKITTKIVFDRDWNIIEHSYFEYNGPVAELKGEESKAEQASADQTRKDENALMQQQLNAQLAQLQGVNSTIDPIIQSITRGQTPPVLQPLQSALTASYTNNLANNFRNAAGMVNQNLLARGITGGQMGAGAGAAAQQFGQLGAMQGQLAQSGATNAAELMNQQSLGLLQNDLGLKLGVANQFGGNTALFNQGMLGALGQGVTAANNVDQAQTSMMGPLMGGLFSLGTAGLTGGLSAAFPGANRGGCWIAAACFDGWGDIRVKFIRMRLWQRAKYELKFAILTDLYTIFGKPIAKLVSRYSSVKSLFTKLFNNFMRTEINTVLNEAVNGRR